MNIKTKIKKICSDFDGISRGLIVAVICFIIGNIYVVDTSINVIHVAQKRIAAKKYIAEECLGINYKFGNLTVEVLDSGTYVCYNDPDASVFHKFKNAIMLEGKDNVYRLGNSERDSHADEMVSDWVSAQEALSVLDESYSVFCGPFFLYAATIDLFAFMFIICIIIRIIGEFVHFMCFKNSSEQSSTTDTP